MHVSELSDLYQLLLGRVFCTQKRIAGNELSGSGDAGWLSYSCRDSLETQAVVLSSSKLTIHQVLHQCVKRLWSAKGSVDPMNRMNTCTI
jgi:hypothetical protein